MHGYRAGAVFLSYEDTADLALLDGYISINPSWFWYTFTTYFNRVFDDLETNPQSTYRESCIEYLRLMLSLPNE